MQSPWLDKYAQMKNELVQNEFKQGYTSHGLKRKKNGNIKDRLPKTRIYI